jgi:esterase/lipase superfamily enzyme
MGQTLSGPEDISARQKPLRGTEASYAAITVCPTDVFRKVGEVRWPTSLPEDPRRNFVTVSADYPDKQASRVSIAATA